MKTASDPRHQQRRNLVRNLFAFSFTAHQDLNPESQAVIANLPKIDKKIVLSAPEWPIDKINKSDLAILRLAVYELLIVKKTPEKVIIDEAVELAKEFGSDNSPGFVNGVLGHIINPPKRQKSTPSTNNQ